MRDPKNEQIVDGIVQILHSQGRLRLTNGDYHEIVQLMQERGILGRVKAQTMAEFSSETQLVRAYYLDNPQRWRFELYTLSKRRRIVPLGTRRKKLLSILPSDGTWMIGSDRDGVHTWLCENHAAWFTSDVFEFMIDTKGGRL